MLQVDESTDTDNKAILLVYMRYFYQGDVHKDMLCALSLPTKTTATELFKSLDDYISGLHTCTLYLFLWCILF